MKRGLYANRPNLTIGFHGCDQSLVDKVIAGKENLLASTNDYDWLGSGIYFWENNEERAMEWAVELSKRPGSSVKQPAVIGAIIDLGYCFDLTDTAYLKELKKSYDFALEFSRISGIPLPVNKNIVSIVRQISEPMILYVACSGKESHSIPMQALQKRTIYRFVSVTRIVSKDISCHAV